MAGEKGLGADLCAGWVSVSGRAGGGEAMLWVLASSTQGGATGRSPSTSEGLGLWTGTGSAPEANMGARGMC